MTSKRRYIKRKARGELLKFIKRYTIMAIVIAFIVSFALIVEDNIDLKRTVASLNNLQGEYRNLTSDDTDNYIVDYKYWVEKYRNLRDEYLEQLQYLGEENLNYEIYTVTGYSKNDKSQGTTSITSIGVNLDAQYMEYIDIVAVDPDIIEYGSYVFIKADWQGNGHICEKMFIAGDCGGDIKGQRIDVYFDTKDEANSFGLQGCPVKVIAKEGK